MSSIIKKTPGRRQQSFLKIAFAVSTAFLLLINILILYRLGINLLLQAYSLTIIALLTITGLVLLGKSSEIISDWIMRCIVAFSIGLIVYSTLNFILLHVNIPILIRLINIIFFLSILSVFFVRRRQFIFSHTGISISRINITWIIILSLIISFATTYGFYNNPHGPRYKNQINDLSFLVHPEQAVPNWGENRDKHMYIPIWCHKIAQNGLPGKELQHQGVQSLFVSLVRLILPWNIIVAIKLYKCISFTIYFSLFYILAYIGKYFFSANRVETALIVLATPLFSAINYPIFFSRHSSYLGFFMAGTTMYHSVTQVFCLLLGAAGILLLLFSTVNRSTIFPAGCFLITGSFFFKPSLFALAMPLIVVVFAFIRQVTLKEKIQGFSILLIPPIFWVIYGAAFNLHSQELAIAFQPFRVMGHYAAYHFPKYILQQTRLRNTLILVFSFAVFIPIIIDFIITYFSCQGKHSPYVNRFRHLNIPKIFLILLFLFGALSYALLVQDNKLWAFGNFGWGTAAATVLFLPLLIILITRIRLLVLRILAIGLFVLHIWGGVFQLYIFTFRGVIF